MTTTSRSVAASIGMMTTFWTIVARWERGNELNRSFADDGRVSLTDERG